MWGWIDPENDLKSGAILVRNMNPRLLFSFLLVASFLSLSGCTRIYVASPDVLAMREPPGVKVGQVLSDLRTIGTALEAYNVDQNGYPVVTESDLASGTTQFAHIVRLESSMKNYARNLSAEDPWGNPYLYWSSGGSSVVLSTGSDGIIGDPSAFQQVVTSVKEVRVFVKQKTNNCLEDEIIFSGGTFLQAPTYATKECSKK